MFRFTVAQVRAYVLIRFVIGCFFFTSHTHEFYMLTSALLDLLIFFFYVHTNTPTRISKFFYNFVYSLFLKKCLAINNQLFFSGFEYLCKFI